MKGRVLFLLTTYGWTMLAFVVAKVVFMLCCHEVTPVLTVADVKDVVVHGLSLDLSTALYVLLLPLVATMVAVWRAVPRWLVSVYFGVVAAAMALAFVADTSLYPFWRFKLDASCLGYLSTPDEAMASVTTSYLLLRLAVLVMAAILIYRGFPRTVLGPSRARLAGRGAETAFYVLLMPAVVIGLRGGLGESTTNVGQVYYSQNQFLNHSAVNPVFSFLSSLEKSSGYIVSYDFMTDEECQRLTDGLFATADDGPTLLTTTRPNIVIVIMESCGGQFCGIGGRPDIMPNLDRLAGEGINFAECYANSWRTDKGVVSVLSGYPAFPLTSVMKVPEKSRKLPSIASALEGYSSHFYYGGDINFTNMRSYVMGSGYGSICWKSDFSVGQQRTASWGVRDDIMFDTLFDDIVSDTTTHWMRTLLTLSSHEPWDVPTHHLDDPVYNAFNYLDASLGQFVGRLKQTPAWQNLLLVILPDHGYRYRGVDETTRLYNHIPMVWVGGAVREPRRVDVVCSQTDLAATLLSQLNMGHDDFTFSRNVLSASYTQPMALHTFNNGVTLIDSAGFTAYDLDAQTFIAHDGGDADQRLGLARALLQLTSHDLARK